MGGLVSEALSIAVNLLHGLFPLGSAAPFAARTFLPELNQSDRAVCISGAKLVINGWLRVVSF